jgi:sulfur carrier protein
MKNGSLSVYLFPGNKEEGTIRMNITINNEPLSIEGDSITVSRLLELKKYTFRLRIVKINGRIIDRDRYDETMIGESDDVKVIYLMSGG